MGRRCCPPRARRCSGSSSDLIEKHVDELAELESLDNGKTQVHGDAWSTCPARANYFRYMAGWATKIEGSTIEVSIGAAGGRPRQRVTRARARRRGRARSFRGTSRCVMAAWKLAPGARVGLHVRVEARRADAADGAAPRRADHRGGLPAGRRQHPHRLRRNDRRRAGRRTRASTRSRSPARPRSASCINKPATDTLKRVSLELGGKSPVIVLPDADVEYRDRRRRGRDLLQRGPGLRRGLAPVRAPKDLRPGRRRRRQRRAGHQARAGPRSGHADGPARVARAAGAGARVHRSRAAKKGASVVAGGDAPSHEGYYVKPTVLADVKRT